MASEALILSGMRTPIGAFQGSLATVPAPELGALSIKAALERANVPVDEVHEVIMGNVVSAGIGQNPARQAAIKADCNDVAATYTVDGSSIDIVAEPSTLAACPEDSLDQQYLANLSNAAIFFFEESDLFLDLMADGGTMRFTAAPN